MRRPFIVASALSLLLCTAMAAAWTFHYTFPYDPHYLVMRSSNGVTTATDIDFYCYKGRSGVLIKRVHLYADILAKTGSDVGSVMCLYDSATGFVSPQSAGWACIGGRIRLPGDVADSDREVDLSNYRRSNKQFGWFSGTHIVASDWIFALLFGVLPAIWLIRYRNARRAIRRGLCLNCGYDLRASKDRCPECDSPIFSEGTT